MEFRFTFQIIPVALSLSIAAAQAEVDFTKDVRPILEDRCFDCHGEDKQKSAMRLDSATGILRGGESGEPLVVAGKAAESYLFKRITTEDKKDAMPPKGERLSAAQVETLRAWIDGGAQMPGINEARAALKLTTTHWSFQPVKRPAGNSVDEFLAVKLREKGLAMSGPADRATLIRRLFLVMHGMPPSPQVVADFQNDTQPDAYARLVDSVLTSPRFGERWARHWMDVARYADSNGFETNRERKTAYFYRDWLVEAFNADKPYDVFIEEQIAGDALGADAATGFLVAGPHDIVKSPDINLTLMQREDELTDMVNTTGTAFLGLTMGCARCHNHKFDPILQKDYFAMQAVFAGVNHGERTMRKTANAESEKAIAAARAEETALSATVDDFQKRAFGGLRAPVNAKLNEETFAATDAIAVRFTIRATNSAEPCIDELEVFDADGKNVALGARPSSSGNYGPSPIHKLEHINDGKTGNERSWISNTAGKGWVQLDFPAKARISRIAWGRARDEKFADRLATQYVIEAAAEPEKWKTVTSSEDRRPFGTKPDDLLAKLPPADADAARKVQAELAAVQKRIGKLSGANTAWLGTFSQPGKTHRLYRGEPMQKREVVAPDALSVLGTLGLAVEEPEQKRRIALAEWIANAKNPLTARVMVNRLWQYTFGTGIVDTPSDFGKNGTSPTHPELLDWLADEFVRSGWSVKHIQRLLLNSAAFQQSSAPRADALAADSGGRLLWRYTPRRLEAEAIRDSMLTVSGALDVNMGGPGFYLMDVVEENVMHYFPKEKFAPSEFRRMVYQFRIRQTTDAVFGSFDCPDGSSVTPKRSRSNTPLQALNLFNSTFVVGQADILAKRLTTEAGPTPEAQAALAFRLFYNREPEAKELSASAAMIREHGTQSFARAMFNTSEFLFVF